MSWGHRVGYTFSCAVVGVHDPKHVLPHQAVRHCVKHAPWLLPAGVVSIVSSLLKD